jgi:hypothetical protein
VAGENGVSVCQLQNSCISISDGEGVLGCDGKRLTVAGLEGYLGRYPLLWGVLESASTIWLSEKDRDLAVTSRQSWED